MARMRAVDTAVGILEREGATQVFGVPGAAINRSTRRCASRTPPSLPCPGTATSSSWWRSSPSGPQFNLPYIQVLVNNSYLGLIRQAQRAFAMDARHAFEEAHKLMAEHRVPVVVEIILERITNIAIGQELDGIIEFEDLSDTDVSSMPAKSSGLIATGQ